MTQQNVGSVLGLCASVLGCNGHMKWGQACGRNNTTRIIGPGHTFYRESNAGLGEGWSFLLGTESDIWSGGLKWLSMSQRMERIWVNLSITGDNDNLVSTSLYDNVFKPFQKEKLEGGKTWVGGHLHSFDFFLGYRHLSAIVTNQAKPAFWLCFEASWFVTSFYIYENFEFL